MQQQKPTCVHIYADMRCKNLEVPACRSEERRAREWMNDALLVIYA